MGDEYDDLPSTGGVGLVPPTAAQMPGRVLALEVRQKRIIDGLASGKSIVRGLVIAVVTGSLGVMVTVIGAAVYVGGRFQAVTDLDRRVSRIEDRGATYTNGAEP
jgi:hypothetical protein